MLAVPERVSECGVVNLCWSFYPLEGTPVNFSHGLSNVRTAAAIYILLIWGGFNESKQREKDEETRCPFARMLVEHGPFALVG